MIDHIYLPVTDVARSVQFWFKDSEDSVRQGGSLQLRIAVTASPPQISVSLGSLPDASALPGVASRRPGQASSWERSP
jgi:hypothetical protein